MRKAIVLSRVSTLQQNLRQQTEEILREVYKDGHKKEEVIVIEDKESAIKLSKEERRGLNKPKERMMKGRKFNIAMGKSGGGRTPFGYTTDKNKRYVIPRNLFPYFFVPPRSKARVAQF